MSFVSFAQNTEDLMLWRALCRIERGFWIDAGAADPDEMSVTRAFYDRGWNGVNIEPAEHYFERLRAARPRDVNLRVALASVPGSRPFHVVCGTGLSTFDQAGAEQYRRAGHRVETTTVAVHTLAEICRWHAPHDIHFLKIDVEGAEAELIAGADFTHFRPWIVLVEATLPLSREESHADWEECLLGQDYVFVWFDGINRFYVARERATELAPSFRLPPNHLDDYVLAAEQQRRDELIRLAAELEQARRGRSRAERERDLQSAEIAAAQAARDEALRHRHATEAEAVWLRRSLEAARESQPPAPEPVAPEPPVAQPLAVIPAPAAPASLGRRAWRRARSPVGRLAWRTREYLTAELRADIGRLAMRDPGPSPAPPPASAITGSTAPQPLALPAPAPPISATRNGVLRAVHQFHPSVTAGDAITNGMVLTRNVLRRLGFDSEIYVRHRDEALAGTVRLLDDLPAHADYVLMVHHSFGDPEADRITAVPAPKILVYHNITPASLLGDPFLRSMAELGREQLGLWRPLVASAIADSAYNALELKRAGYRFAVACQTLFDPDALLATARAARIDRSGADMLTILFVGRIVASKGQADLVDAYAAFRRLYRARPARLVLVGRVYGGGEAYEAEIRRRIARHGLAAEVELTGHVDDDALHGWYAHADIYASMSLHEGFGVPLVEAMAHGVPIVAVAAGAVAFTVGEGGILLDTPDPPRMAEAWLALANDPERRMAILAAQSRQIGRFSVSAQLPLLVEALALAGAARPAGFDASEIRRALHVVVAGHVNGAYSLAAVNRGLALALEDAIPGRVGLLPVEGERGAPLVAVPHAQWDRLETLASRDQRGAGPLAVISQHYPVWVPDMPAELRAAMFFWEESLVPDDTVALLNGVFDAVLAPSRFVARALVDSGVTVPVRVVGNPLRLDELAGLPERPARQPGDVFTFLHVSSAFPRKGVDVLLAAWARAFGTTDRVRLVLKTFPNPHNDAAQRIADLRALHPDLCEIVHLDIDLPPDEMRIVYAGADAMVLPSRGEGFNMPAAEAMAAGIPLIVSAAGAHRDFIEPDDAILIPGCHAASASHVASEGSLWFEPDAEALVAAMRRVVDEPDDIRAMARRARTATLQRLERTGITDRLVSDLAELLARPRPEPATRFAIVTSWGIRCGIAEYTALLLGALPPGAPPPTVLADHRSSASDAAPVVVPSWEIGDHFEVATLARAVARADPQILMIQHQPGLIAWPHLASLLVEPRVCTRTIMLTLHNTRDLETMAEPERAPLVDALRLAARLVVHTAADLDRLLGLGLDNATMIPHGATPAGPDRTPAVRTLLAGEAPIIGTYGFLLKPKGFGPLIEALQIVRRTWPRATLRMVTAIYDEGPSEVEHHGLLDFAARIGLSDEIDWHTGFLPRSTSLELLRGCDLLVLPYRPTGEAASGALHTALGSLVPTAVTPVDIFNEAGEAVSRLPGLDPDSMAAGIVTLLQDPDGRRALVQRQVAWLQRRSWARIARRTIGMLEALHNESQGFVDQSKRPKATASGGAWAEPQPD